MVDLRSRPWSRSDFLAYFEAFLRAHPELTATCFGRLVCSDKGFMSRLRAGKANYCIFKFERAVTFIRTYEFGDDIRLLKKHIRK